MTKRILILVMIMTVISIITVVIAATAGAWLAFMVATLGAAGVGLWFAVATRDAYLRTPPSPKQIFIAGVTLFLFVMGLWWMILGD
jgi:uncharacterized protein (DUF58 family)